MHRPFLRRGKQDWVCHGGKVGWRPQKAQTEVCATKGGVVASAAMKQTFSARQLLKVLRGQTTEMVECLRRVVECESPSLEKVAADRCCGVLAKEWARLGARVERVAQKKRGDHLRIVWAPAGVAVRGQILVLGHYDTVYASGTLRAMPFRVKSGQRPASGIWRGRSN